MNRLDKKLYSWAKHEIYLTKCKPLVGYDHDKNAHLLCGFFYLKKLIYIEYIYIYISGGGCAVGHEFAE